MAAAPYADVRETHTGLVILAADRAYKAKKPVLTDFLDFRTPAQRERACHREVELNSRLSPSSYLGVAHLSDPSGGPAEPIVVMRRYDDRDRLTSMATSDHPGILGVLDTIAGVLARFHGRADRSPLIDCQGSVDAIERRWRDNLSEIQRHVGMEISGVSDETIEQIGRLASSYIAGRAPLFANRIENYCIVDGHGDLLADDIFWVNGAPALLDCLEFDDELRYVDCIDDAAFLAMDLEFLGRKDLGDHFLERYVARSAETAPSSLLDFYIAYRAVVRAKVDCVRLSQGNQEAAADAMRHFAIAAGHLQDGAVRLALIGGGPGTGKSTLAHALAKTTGALIISTDNVRRELRDSGAISGDPGILHSGLYSLDNVATVYEVVLRRAHRFLGSGQSVILDGTWRDPGMRAAARNVAAQTHSALVELRCSAATAATAERITARQPGNSDATPEIAAELAARHDQWDTAHRLDTSRLLEDSLREAHETWRRAM
ncbi:hypothetical protein A5791_12460 [Mycobacterium sp. 852002-51163_SCH5372311]|nr:hypothetical protein A5791_12460 [Mycobacterium sp. 852002-51163_SCH5372311]